MLWEEKQGHHWYCYDPATKKIVGFRVDYPVVMENLKEDHILICRNTILGTEGFITLFSRSFEKYKKQEKPTLNDIEKAVLIAVNKIEASKPGIKHFRLHELNKAGWKMSKIEYDKIMRMLLNEFLINKDGEITEKGKKLVKKYPNLDGYKNEVEEKKKRLGYLYNGTA